VVNVPEKACLMCLKKRGEFVKKSVKNLVKIFIFQAMQKFIFSDKSININQ